LKILTGGTLISNKKNVFCFCFSKWWALANINSFLPAHFEEKQKIIIFVVIWLPEFFVILLPLFSLARSGLNFGWPYA